jgi:hypothetical protein
LFDKVLLTAECPAILQMIENRASHPYWNQLEKGGGPRCLDSLMGVISSESVFGFLNFIEKHQAALVKGWGRL